MLLSFMVAGVLVRPAVAQRTEPGGRVVILCPGCAPDVVISQGLPIELVPCNPGDDILSRILKIVPQYRATYHFRDTWTKQNPSHIPLQDRGTKCNGQATVRRDCRQVILHPLFQIIPSCLFTLYLPHAGFAAMTEAIHTTFCPTPDFLIRSQAWRTA